MTPSEHRPQLSVVVITPGDYEVCRRTIGFLERQTALDDLELVIVAPSREELHLDQDDVEAFVALQVVEVGPLESTGSAFAAGVRRARADWVAYCEEHSYPQPGWAEGIIAAQEGPWAVIGCAMANANPDSLASWASLIAEFGPVVTPVDSGETGYVGGHHAIYRRELLLPFGEMLEPLLEFEVALHQTLMAQGHRLYLAGDAVSAHLNVSRLWWLIEADYLGQRGFGAMRWQGQGWSLPRRLLYAAACPLIPPLRLLRSVKHAWRCCRGKRLIPWIFLPMSLALIAGALGEALGYLFGAGRAATDRIDIELERDLFIAEGDKARKPEPSG